jgi:p-cumate 2,3-dioxygenase beta subunit
MTQTQRPLRDVAPIAPSRFSRSEVEDFLFYEADLLDAWRLDEWRELFAPDGRYIVPSTDDPDGDPDVHLALINDDEVGRRGRIQRLMSTWAHIENPHSLTRRLVGNVRVWDEQAALPEVGVRCSTIVYRSRPSGTTTYAGQLTYRLRHVDGAFAIVLKRVNLDHHTLRDSGGVLSILI